MVALDSSHATIRPAFSASGLPPWVRPWGVWQTRLVALAITSVILGCFCFLFLGWLVLAPKERCGFWKLCLFTPVYWTMLSWAAWCAFIEQWRRPHHWAKTPHRTARAF
ncbi:hypothetical protein [Devosia sp.]|uniref:hypothetical protein n=1 Tax=Devosia sp. TaxID=1871048 RepID=UPI002FC608F3